MIASCNGQLTIVSGWVQSMTWDFREKGIAPVSILCMGVCVRACVHVCVCMCVCMRVCIVHNSHYIA